MTALSSLMRSLQRRHWPGLPVNPQLTRTAATDRILPLIATLRSARFQESPLAPYRLAYHCPHLRPGERLRPGAGLPAGHRLVRRRAADAVPAGAVRGDDAGPAAPLRVHPGRPADRQLAGLARHPSGREQRPAKPAV